MKRRISGIMCAVLATIFVLSAPMVASALYEPVTLEDIAEAADTAASLTEEWFGNADGITYSDEFESDKTDSAIINTLALYKAFREGNYLKHGAESVALQRGLFAFADVQKALDDYNARATMLDEMEERMLVKIVDADVTLKVEKCSKENGKLVLYVNEWTFFDYDDLEGEGDAIDVSGYGVDHIITLSDVGGKWLIEGDVFNDSLMGMPAPEEEKVNTKTYKDGGLRQAGVSAINGKITQTASYTIYSGYNPSAAVAYSEKYVYHGAAGGTNYESYYNTAYYNFNPLGGDCANYTSQSIYAGGMPQVVCANYGVDGWFYNTSSNRSGSWTGAKELRTYMSNARGKQINNPSNSQVWMGCPMFVDWTSNGSYDHAYFCVGQNSSGTAIINSHNYDQYHVKWNYGGTGATYSTVQITTSNHASISAGWQQVGGYWKYMKSDGNWATGWLNDNGTWYYMDASGNMQTGWVSVNGIWYYLNESGKMQTGWIAINDIWYYLNDNGEMQTGWAQVDGAWYYLEENGAMQKGWLDLSGAWYYLAENGVMQTGWQTIGDAKYYFNASGIMQTGLQTIDGSEYYFGEGGGMKTGWLKVNGEYSYFDSTAGKQSDWQSFSEGSVNTLNRVTAGTDTDDFTQTFEGVDWSLFSRNGNQVTGTAIIATGCVIKFYDAAGAVIESKTISVTGDTNGDGAITSSDVIATSAHITASSLLTDAFFEAADMDGSSSVSPSDYIALIKKITG